MNSSPLSVLEFVAVAALAAVCGCGDNGPAARSVDDFVDEATAKLAVADLKGAIAAISNAYELAAGDVDVRLLKAQIDYHARNFATSAKLFEGVAKDMTLDRRLRAQGWAGLGVLAHNANDVDTARLDFLRALRCDGKNASAWYHLGYIYRYSYEYYEAACDCFETFVRLETTVDARVQKVQRSFIKDLREARVNMLLEIPGARNPDPAACAKALQAAEAAVRKGTFKTARLRYDEALKADPTSFPAALGLAKMWLKTDTGKAGKASALDYYRRACKLSPSSVSTFLAAGELAMANGNAIIARELYSRAIAADPTNISAIDGHIRALRKLGKTKQAAAYQEYRDFLSVKMK